MREPTENKYPGFNAFLSLNSLIILKMIAMNLIGNNAQLLLDKNQSMIPFIYVHLIIPENIFN